MLQPLARFLRARAHTRTRADLLCAVLRFFWLISLRMCLRMPGSMNTAADVDNVLHMRNYGTLDGKCIKDGTHMSYFSMSPVPVACCIIGFIV